LKGYTKSENVPTKFESNSRETRTEKEKTLQTYDGKTTSSRHTKTKIHQKLLAVLEQEIYDLYHSFILVERER